MIACTASSQSSYPRTVVIDHDTCEAITRPQMRSLIALRYASDECDSVRAVLFQEVAAQRLIAVRQDSCFTAAQQELQGYDAEVAMLNGQLRLKDDELKVNKDLMKRKNRAAKAGGITGGGVALAIGILIGIFIHK